MRKSQIQSQVFIYILVLVVAAGILLYGYNAIKQLRTQADNALYIQFENDLKKDLQTLSYQSTKSKTYSLPSFTEEVCFKTENAGDSDVTAEANIKGLSNAATAYSLIRAAINNNVQENVFLYPSGEKSFFTGIRIALGTGGTGPINFRCFDVIDGSLVLRITGEGSYISIASAE